MPIDSSIQVTFSEPINPTTITTAQFSLTNGSAPVAGIVTYNGSTASFTPAAPLATNTSYTANISTGVKDLSGNPMAANYSWSFFTGGPDITPPSVIGIAPAAQVPIDSNITVTFSELIDPTTITSAQFTLITQLGSFPVAGTVSYNGLAATFTPAAPLAINTYYTVNISAGVRDLSGNPMASNYSWSFQSFSPATPTIVSSSPVAYAYAVALNSAISATFSTPMDPATLTSASFTLLEGATPVAGTVTYSGSTVTFTPAAPLVTNRVYRATITTAAKDLAGTAMWADHSWTFQTFSDGSTTGPVNPPPVGLWQPPAGATPAIGNFVYLSSDTGDYIGLGNTYLYTPATAVISVTETGGMLTVNITGNDWWYGHFQVMNSLTQLQPGFYPGLQRYPFHNPVFGGLDWSGNGRGCNTLKGWFAIDNVVYGISGTLTSFDLRFEQNCEGGTTALHGAIHWGP